MTEVVEDVLAKRELAEKVAAAREEQREACARLFETTPSWEPERAHQEAAFVRSTPLTATPLADRIAELEAHTTLEGIKAIETARTRELEAELADLRAAAESAANVTKTLTVELDRIYALPGVRSQGDRSDVPDCVEALIEHQECRITETERRGKEIGLADAAVEIKTLTEENVGLRVKLEARFLSLDAAMDLTRTLTEERDAARAALTKISAIRDSIVGTQSFHWSEHAYPLVAVLGAAGFPGAGYEIARKNIGTLIEQANAARAELETVRDQAAEAFDTAVAAYEEMKAAHAARVAELTAALIETCRDDSPDTNPCWCPDWAVDRLREAKDHGGSCRIARAALGHAISATSETPE